MEKRISETKASIAHSHADTLKSLGMPEGVVVPTNSHTEVSVSPIIENAVTYVGKKNNIWKAILRYNGELKRVGIGSELQDSAKVVSITEDGVTIQKNGKNTFIAIASNP